MIRLVQPGRRWSCIDVVPDGVLGVQIVCDTVVEEGVAVVRAAAAAGSKRSSVTVQQQDRLGQAVVVIHRVVAVVGQRGALHGPSRG